jgi:predicted tellurium resistance membrane protein TerC
MELFSGAALAHLVEVLGVNIVLSGDNAVVIAMASAV